MDNKIQKNIILPAWDIIRNNGRLKKFYFFPGLLSIIFLSVLLVYQAIYTYVEVFGYKEDALRIILNFFHSSYALEVIIAWIIFLLVYILITPIFEWGLIKYIESLDNGKKPGISDSLWMWLYRFFPLFEYNNIFSEFKLISILNAYLFVIRFVGIEYFNYISYVFVFVFIFSVVINILFAYSKYVIVVWNKKMFPAIWESSKIAILNITTTFKLYFLMFILHYKNISYYYYYPPLSCICWTYTRTRISHSCTRNIQNSTLVLCL